MERVLFEDVEEEDGTSRPKRVTGIAVRRNRAAGQGGKTQKGAEGHEQEQEEQQEEEEEIIEASSVVLAAGHSSRVLFEGMHEDGVKLAYQSFAAGFRIEHPQVGFCLLAGWLYHVPLVLFSHVLHDASFPSQT